MLTIMSDRAGVTEGGVNVPVGTKCEYLGHVSGGMVRVRLPSGHEDVMHPACFEVRR